MDMTWTYLRCSEKDIRSPGTGVRRIASQHVGAGGSGPDPDQEQQVHCNH